MNRGIVRSLLVVAALFAFGASFASAQHESSIKVRVSPPEAYIFVDGQPFAHRSQTIFLSTGQHTIGVYNYGFVPQVQEVRLEPGRNPDMVARLEPVPGMTKGPWGRLQIEGNANDRAAVFINGLKPEYFVGHVDEMNNEFLATQKLVLPVGTYDLFIVNPKETEPFFTSKIEIKNDQRLVVNVGHNTQTYHRWKKAGHRTELARFHTGANNASIAVAPVTGAFSVDKNAIRCGDNVQLSWNSTEAVDTTIAASPAVAVPATGQKTESPTKTTTYTFEAKGPGGVVTQSQTVHVDPHVQTALKADPAEVRYRRIDDKVIVAPNTNLAWTADNAQQASIDPVGSVATNGQQTVAASPKKTDVGPVDEMVVYTLVASNNCGGSDKSMAAVHVTGTIEPLPVVPLASIFFPTAYPTMTHPELGLLNGEKAKLAEAVTGFNKFLEYDPATKIKIISFADHRATDEYNNALADRRANLIKAHLVALGVSESKIETEIVGEQRPLSDEEVATLEGKKHIPHSLGLAYNRRADLVMIPTEKPQQVSEKVYPHKIKGAKLLRSPKFQSTNRIRRISDIVEAPSAAGQQ